MPLSAGPAIQTHDHTILDKAEHKYMGCFTQYGKETGQIGDLHGQ